MLHIHNGILSIYEGKNHDICKKTDGTEIIVKQNKAESETKKISFLLFLFLNHDHSEMGEMKSQFYWDLCFHDGKESLTFFFSRV